MPNDDEGGDVNISWDSNMEMGIVFPTTLHHFHPKFHITNDYYLL